MDVKNILTALQVENAKPVFKPVTALNKNGGSAKSKTPPFFIDKDYIMSDSGELSLIVKPNGSNCWHFRYQFEGRKNKTPWAFSRKSPLK